MVIMMVRGMAEVFVLAHGVHSMSVPLARAMRQSHSIDDVAPKLFLEHIAVVSSVKFWKPMRRSIFLKTVQRIRYGSSKTSIFTL